MIEIFAERGFSTIYPENTLLGFTKAFESGAHGVTADVRMTQDEELVLMQDLTVDRTTDGSGPVSALTLNDIFRLDAGAWKGIAYENEPVPTLASLLGSKPPQAKVILNIYEERGYRQQIFFSKLGELITQFQNKSSLIISSSSYKLLSQAKERLDGISCALMPASGLRGIFARHLFRHSVNVDAFHIPASSVSPGLIRSEHLCNRLVRALAPIDSYQLLQVQKAGVDGIIICDPVLGLVYSD